MDYVRLKIHICINIHKHGCINNLKRLARGKRWNDEKNKILYNDEDESEKFPFEIRWLDV